jgi:hypothetical protein
MISNEKHVHLTRQHAEEDMPEPMDLTHKTEATHEVGGDEAQSIDLRRVSVKDGLTC